MKKKAYIWIVVVVVVLWLAMGITDWFRLNSFDLPIFCVHTQRGEDGVSGTYVGLGYSFELEGNFDPDHPIPGMTRYTYKIFGQTVKTAIRD